MGKKRRPRERGATDGSADSRSLSADIEALSGSEIQLQKERTKGRSKTKDKEETKSRSRSFGSSLSADIMAIPKKVVIECGEEQENATKKEKPKNQAKKAKTLSRKSLGLPGRIKKDQPMPFLDLPCKPRVNEISNEDTPPLFTKPLSAREHAKPIEHTATRSRLLSDGGTERLRASMPDGLQLDTSN